jgi:hypothetical protein
VEWELAGKPKYSEKTCPSATLSTTNSKWPDPGRRGGKPATNRLGYGTASACTKLSPEHTSIYNYSKFHFNIILSPTRRFYKWLSSFGYLNSNFVCTYRLCYVSHQYYAPSFDHPNDIWWRVQQVKRLFTYNDWFLLNDIITDCAMSVESQNCEARREPLLWNGSASMPVVRWWLSKRHLTAATLTYATIEVPLGRMFSMRSVPTATSPS